MEDRELWGLMRLKDAMEELDDRASRLRCIRFLLDRFGLGKLDESDVTDGKAKELPEAP